MRFAITLVLAYAAIATLALAVHTAIIGTVDLSSYAAGVVALLVCFLVRAD